MNGDVASMIRANASAMRSSRASSAAMAKSGGSRWGISGASSWARPRTHGRRRAQQRVDEGGVEPATAAALDHRASGFDSAAGMDAGSEPPARQALSYLTTIVVFIPSAACCGSVQKST